MEDIIFPSNFPSETVMLDILRKTFENSWKVDLDVEDVEKWLQNFSGKFFNIESERKLALWMLCNFTYYNETEVNHLCAVLFKNLIHRLMLDNGLSTEKEAELCILSTAFTSVGRASESGGLLLYHFRQESHLDLTRFIFPTDIATTESNIIVCIDDVMMSGGTAQRFFHDRIGSLTGKKVYYITLLTTERAITKLETLGISVIYCAKLDGRNQAFSEESLMFYKYPTLRQSAKLMAEGYGKIIEPKKPLGHNDGQYCFGLFYNIPNNSLPIFWSTNNGWNPILLRKEKYQNAKQAKREYSFFI